MKVTKKDILSIKAGSSKVMQLDSYPYFRNTII